MQIIISSKVDDLNICMTAVVIQNQKSNTFGDGATRFTNSSSRARKTSLFIPLFLKHATAPASRYFRSTRKEEGWSIFSCECDTDY